MARAMAGATLVRLQHTIGKEVALALSKDEFRVASELAAAFQALRFTAEGEVETKSEAGQLCCKKFLDELASTAERLQCEPADRSYRKQFTPNYQILFPDMTRRYRLDVLEASVEGLDTFWVNGAQFRLSREMLSLGAALQEAWGGFCSLLRTWDLPGGSKSVACLRFSMCSLDLNWAAFEHKYILELIKIEEEARGLIVVAIDCEKSLQDAERLHGKASKPTSEARRALVAQVGRLNSVANVRRKGRDDLKAEILERAHEVLLRSTGRGDAAGIIAGGVVDTFKSLRKYFRSASRCLERVDPYLGNNPGLVERLATWEEAWEIGQAYLQRPRLLAALCAAVRHVKLVQAAESDFAGMCEDCDAELFMVLPRVMWLGFLEDPGGHGDLFARLLPEAFVAERGEVDASAVAAGGSSPMQVPGAELQEFVDRFGRICGEVGAGLQLKEGVPAEARAACRLLAHRAVEGTGCALAPTPTEPQAPAEGMEDFMRDLEAWSLKLQRGYPEAWNACSAVVLRCSPLDEEVVMAVRTERSQGGRRRSTFKI